MGYHIREIGKGVLGEYSKIVEEFEEWSDALEQGDPILQLCELSDLLGAIESYTLNKWDIDLRDLQAFNQKTVEAFKEGKR